MDFFSFKLKSILFIFFPLQVLMYDLRSTKPLLVKDHQYGLPINSIAFQDKLDVVLSSDSKILKIWDRETVSTSCSLYRSTM